MRSLQNSWCGRGDRPSVCDVQIAARERDTHHAGSRHERRRFLHATAEIRTSQRASKLFSIYINNLSELACGLLIIRRPDNFCIPGRNEVSMKSVRIVLALGVLALSSSAYASADQFDWQQH